MRVLDLMDESVGAFALPITATLIAVVFAWYQNSEALAGQIGTGFVRALVRYGIPAVLVIVTALRLVGDVSFPWQYTGPDAGAVGLLPRAGLLALVGLVLLVVGRALARRLPGPRRSRRRGLKRQ